MSNVNIELKDNEALVIFEWLSEHSHKKTLENIVGDKATAWGFEHLLAGLEPKIDCAFSKDYGAQLEAAKKRILNEIEEIED